MPTRKEPKIDLPVPVCFIRTSSQCVYLELGEGFQDNLPDPEVSSGPVCVRYLEVAGCEGEADNAHGKGAHDDHAVEPTVG